DNTPREFWFSRRFGLAEGAIRVTLDYPLLGVGPAQNKYFIPRALPDWQYEKHGSHNTYLGISADEGLIALVLFCLLFFGAIRGLGGVMRAAESGAAALAFDPRLVRAAYCTLIALAVASLGDALEREKYLWLLIGIAIAIRIRTPVSEGTASEDVQSQRLPE